MIAVINMTCSPAVRAVHGFSRRAFDYRGEDVPSSIGVLCILQSCNHPRRDGATVGVLGWAVRGEVTVTQ